MDQQYQPDKTYLVYGDSGSGKSSFIKYLQGKSIDDKLPETGGGGDSMTQDSGKIYIVQDEILGKIQFIDTRGTWDPSAPDNNSIIDNLVKCLVDFSVGNMSHQLKPEQYLDGVIYIHNSLQYDRYARDSRIAHLSTLIGCNLLQSTLTIMTQYSSLLRLDTKEQEKFQNMIQNKHYCTNKDGEKEKTSEYMLWDSENPLENQKENLNQILQFTLKTFDLTNINDSNQSIIDMAKKLREEDLVDTTVITQKKIFKEVVEYKIEKDDYEDQKTLTIDVPKSLLGSVLQYTSLTSNMGNYLSGNHKTENFSVVPRFPKNSCNPKSLISCSLVGEKFDNAGYTKDPIFDNRGDYYECVFNYMWKNIKDNSSLGRIDLKIKVEIQFRVQYTYNQFDFIDVKTQEMLPLHLTEGPYLSKAKEICMEKIYNDIKRVTQGEEMQEIAL